MQPAVARRRAFRRRRGSVVVRGALRVVGAAAGTGEYFDCDVEELGGNTVQLDVWLAYRHKGSGSCLKFAVIEDIQADATTDLGLHVSFASRCGAR